MRAGTKIVSFCFSLPAMPGISPFLSRPTKAYFQEIATGVNVNQGMLAPGKHCH